jgi:hypothetical protein
MDFWVWGTLFPSGVRRYSSQRDEFYHAKQIPNAGGDIAARCLQPNEAHPRIPSVVGYGTSTAR